MAYPNDVTPLDIPAGGQTLFEAGHTNLHGTERAYINSIINKVGANSSTVTTSHDYKLSDITGTSKAVSVSGTQTLTNKTLVDPTLNLGSDATGDIYYRSAGILTRLPIGTTGHILNVSGGLPAWSAPNTSGVRRVKAVRTTSQSIDNNSETAIIFTAEDFDTDSMFDSGSNPTRVTFTTAGVYAIQGNFVWSDNTSGRRYALVKVNGTTTINQTDGNPSTANGVTTHSFSVLYSATAGDYVEIYAFQQSGGALNITGTPVYLSAFNIS